MSDLVNGAPVAVPASQPESAKVGRRRLVGVAMVYALLALALQFLAPAALVASGIKPDNPHLVDAHDVRWLLLVMAIACGVQSVLQLCRISKRASECLASVGVTVVMLAQYFQMPVYEDRGSAGIAYWYLLMAILFGLTAIYSVSCVALQDAYRAALLVAGFIIFIDLSLLATVGVAELQEVLSLMWSVVSF